MGGPGAGGDGGVGGGGGSTASISSGMGGGGGGGSGGGECKVDDREGCYDGTEGTQDVGICEAGTRICDPIGTWGVCEGQVLPGIEDASIPGDENCDHWTGECQWQHRFGDSGGQRVFRMSVAPDGSSFITGFFDGLLDFGDGAGAQAGRSYVAKFDPSGNGLWSKTFGQDTGASHGRAVAAHPDGGVILVATVYAGPADFGGGLFDPVSDDAVVAVRYAPNGDFVSSWLLDGGLSTWVQPYAAAAGSDGRIAVGGNCGGSIQIGGNTKPCALSSAFVARLDPDGDAPLWINTFGAQGVDNGVKQVLSLAIDEAGDVLAAGWLLSVVDFGVELVGEPGLTTGFLAKLDGDTGTVVWARSLGPFQEWKSLDLALDPDGNPVVATSLSGDFDFGDGCAVASGVVDIDVAIVKLAGNGDCSWVRHFPVAGEQRPHGVAVDGDGRVVVGGFSLGPIDFGLGEHALKGIMDAFLLKLDENGNPLWSRTFGDANDGSSDPENIWSLGVDGDGFIYTTGSFDGNVNFGDLDMSLTNAGATDLFIAKYAP